MADDDQARTEILRSVSRETGEKLLYYEAELKRWQRVKNLVGPNTLGEIWSRHFADSLQLAHLADGNVWVDLGSGAGFPGLVLAIARPDTLIHLVESDGRRCAFLRHIARGTEACAKVWHGRIDAVLPTLDPRPQVVTARALANLSDLIRLAENVLIESATGLFPKGRDYAAELTRAALCWRFEADVIPSRVQPDARIIRIRSFAGSKQS